MDSIETAFMASRVSAQDLFGGYDSSTRVAASAQTPCHVERPQDPCGGYAVASRRSRLLLSLMVVQNVQEDDQLSLGIPPIFCLLISFVEICLWRFVVSSPLRSR